MTEAVGALSLSFQVFAGCVKGFALTSEARNFGENASLIRTMLNFEEYRFVQWATRVGVVGPNASIDPRLNVAVAAELMTQLEQLLSVNGLRARYKLELVEKDLKEAPVNSVSEEVDRPTALGVLGAAISQEKRNEILLRAGLIQSKNHFLKRLWWGAVDRKKFSDLLQDVKQLVDALEKLLDSLQQTESLRILNELLPRIVRINDDTKNLRALESTLEASASSLPVSLSAISAGLKATRIKIESEPRPQRWALKTARASSGHSSLPDSQTSNISPRGSFPWLLSQRDFRVVKELDESGTRGTGVYADEAVYFEVKEVPAQLKSTLRSRVEDLATMLSQHRNLGSMLLRCQGFFEDPEGYRLIYSYPRQEPMNTSPTSMTPPKSLLDMFQEQRNPSVEDRLQLALTVCRTLLMFQTAGWYHKDFRSENVLFFAHADSSAPRWNIRRPFVCGFSFARAESPTEISEQPSADSRRDIYRHPRALGAPTSRYEWHMDLYSLGLVLIEIAEWRRLSRIIKDFIPLNEYDEGVPLSKFPGVGPLVRKRFVYEGEASFRLGTKFAKVVDICLRAIDPDAPELPNLDELQAALSGVEEWCG